MPPALVVVLFLLGASTVDVSTLLLGPLAFLLVAGLVFGVTDGFQFAHLDALLVAVSMVGGGLLLLLLPYAVAAGLAGAVVARL